MNLKRITGGLILSGMLLWGAGCGGGSGVNTTKLPPTDPASGTDAAMSGGGPGSQGGPGSVSDTDITPKTGDDDAAQGGTP